MYEKQDKIIVVGSSMFELIFKLNSIPEKGATALANSFITGFGGKGANQALTIAKLGGNVKFLTCIGDDQYGKMSFLNFKEKGFDLDYIKIIKNQVSGIAAIFLEESGQNSISVYPGANNLLNKKFIKENFKLINSADYIMTQLEIPLDSVELLAKKKRNNIFVLNPSPIDLSLNYSNLLPNVDIMIPNEIELSYLSGMRLSSIGDISKASDKLLNAGIKNIIVTLGSEGVFIKNSKIKTHIKPVKVNVVDTTGAGDIFAGSFLYYYSIKKNIIEAAEYGNRIAALSVTKFGTQTSIPSKIEILEINRSFEI